MGCERTRRQGRAECGVDMKTVFADGAGIREAVHVLRRGGVIAFPTETTYGLGCDPRNAKAVKRIFLIKGRVESKPLQLIAESLKQVKRLAAMTTVEQQLTSKHWPGPLTLLVSLQRGKKLAPKVSPNRIIGIRVSSSAFARLLAKAFGHPIAATSANRSGSTPAFSGRGVVRAFEGFSDTPDLLIDAGRLPRRVPSTVARVHADGTVEVLRKGSIRV